ncbi:hypothetical protein NL676_022214 [Syzygium grande]|nr:hypothetical protein NL676_022214 [Syzygium grande]
MPSFPPCDCTGTIATSFPETAAASFPPCDCTGTAAAPFPPRDNTEIATTRVLNAAVRLGHAAHANLARSSRNGRNETLRSGLARTLHS